MMKTTTHISFCLLVLLIACNNNSSRQEKLPAPSSTLPEYTDTLTRAADTTGTSDEQNFLTTFTAFQAAVKTNSVHDITSFIHFPIQTGMQWTNADVQAGKVNKLATAVSSEAFTKYYHDIFHDAVRRIIPQATSDELHEIDKNINEDYYISLRQAVDKNSRMYEVYEQYPEPNGTADSFFGFIFGRVQGKYKVLAYYGKWPVKTQ
ncbi:hypothetical protein LX64_01297 [Chitinophaga skermanii]|uniref:Gluconate 2-dehydrogenase subunit 3-like protein n=1 Tax=Chitinophaga skermanii TaxID=331697 RepID=A0A327QYY7_9BACT|nr:hypothetical protein [Chitinophaga skermanii]RAJ08643.1 hypothetical protein LX64_01297 [Chitinophaga skermanii]